MVKWKNEQYEAWLRQQEAEVKAEDKPKPPRKCHPPEHDTYEGAELQCPDCKVRWATANRRFTKPVGGVDFDYFTCHCNPPNEFSRFK